MNTKAIEAMEKMAKDVLKMSAELQNEFYNKIEERIGKDEADTIRKTVALYDMFTNESKYNAISKAICESFI